VALVTRADNLVVQGNLSAAREALEQATAIAARMVEAHLKLGELYGRLGEYEAAIDAYRKALALSPDTLLALNNLAYTLAVSRKAPAEALPLAQRAVELAPTDGAVLDTLAWVEHLMGGHASAAKRISSALRRRPDNAAIQLHAAFIYEAVRAEELARNALKEALRLTPTIGESEEDVRALKTRLLAPLSVTTRQVANE
jgi:tetratricopeptide (TPR) repeat protein